MKPKDPLHDDSPKPVDPPKPVKAQPPKSDESDTTKHFGAPKAPEQQPPKAAEPQPPKATEAAEAGTASSRATRGVHTEAIKAVKAPSRTPKVGDVVHYIIDHEATDCHGSDAAAIVTAIQSEDVTLIVFPPGDARGAVAVSGAKFCDTDKKPGTWHWPEGS